MRIDAYRWLRRAEETMREADYEGIFDFSCQMQDALDTLYIAWLEPCDFVEKWISSLEACQHRPDNSEDFRRACDDVREIVERRDWSNRSTSARVLSMTEEQW